LEYKFWKVKSMGILKNFNYSSNYGTIVVFKTRM
jgi:hypothetical protein